MTARPGRCVRAPLQALLGLVAPLCAAHEQPVSELEEIVVVESRLAADAVPFGDRIGVAGEALDRIGPQDVEQLFARLAGFSVSRAGGPGGVSEIFLRGAESNFTAVIVDGIRLNNPSNTRGGSYDFSMLGIGGVDRIDVAPGTLSAIVGSDAMAGVVRIESAWAAPGAAELLAELGSAGRWRAAAGAGARIGGASTLALGVSSRDAGDAVEGASLSNSTLRSRLTGAWFGGDPWTLNWRYAERTRTGFPEVSGGPQLAVSRELETAEGDEIGGSFLGTVNLSDRFSSQLSGAWVQLREDARTPAVAPGVLDGLPGFTSVTAYRRSQVTWVNRVRAGPRTSTAFGLDWVGERGRDEGGVDFGFAVLPNAYRLDRGTASAFLEVGHRAPGGVTVNLAVRGDAHEQDRRMSAKLGVSRELGPSGGRIWARLGNGFKLPSFFALGNPLFGNPALVPETVESVEAGYSRVQASGRSIGVSFYRHRYADLVDFDFETFRNINKGRIDIDGIELRATLPLGENLRLVADIGRNNISSDSGPLRRRPESTGGAAVEWSVTANVHLNAAARYVGRRLIASVPTGDVIAEGYAFLDATLSIDLSESGSVWLSVDNATGTAYQDAPGFPSPGAGVRLGWRGGL